MPLCLDAAQSDFSNKHGNLPDAHSVLANHVGRSNCTLNWNAFFKAATSIWLYIRTHDDNFAFHVHNNLLSLACCKGDTIREKAKIGDVVVAMTSVADTKPLCVSGIFRVAESLPRQRYYDRYANGYTGLDARHWETGRLDNIYNNGCLLMNEYHCPDSFRTGVLNDMRSDNVILSYEFACFGEGTPTKPGIPVDESFTSIPRGFRKARMLKKDGVFNPFNYEHAEQFNQFLIRIAPIGVTSVESPRHQSGYNWSNWNWKKAATIVKEARLNQSTTSPCKVKPNSKVCSHCT